MRRRTLWRYDLHATKHECSDCRKDMELNAETRLKERCERHRTSPLYWPRQGTLMRP